MNKLNESLDMALKNLEALSEQLKKTKDYSQQSELVFLLKELVLEQLTHESTNNNENTAHTISASR